MGPSMRAMVLSCAGERLAPQERPDPVPGRDEVRVRVLACAVCRTDLHVVDGELRHPASGAGALSSSELGGRP